MIQALKRVYWHVCGRLRKWWDPPSISLSPGSWLDDVVKITAFEGDAGGHLVMVDGGAHTGDMARRFLARFPGLEVHAFEPNTDLQARLEANLSGVPGTIQQSAIGDRTGSTTIEINSSPMTSSVLPVNALSRQYFPDATEPGQRRTVPITRLDDWFKASGLSHVDILKLDLQGYERQALEGAHELLRQGVGCVVLEVNFAAFYEGCSLFAEVDSVLREEGYELFNLYNVCTHRPVNHIGSADAIYVKRERLMRMIQGGDSDSCDAALKLAA
ncbi:MAG: FkbM family methyltransferase [Phycisphaeraceae bacterium]